MNATLQVVENNPFMAIGLAGGQGEKMWNQFHSSEDALMKAFEASEKSFNARMYHAADIEVQLSDEAKKVESVTGLSAIVNP